MLTVQWFKCGTDHHWCSLTDLTLSNVKELGVYIIWYEGNPSRVVRVGQGVVAERLGVHRKDAAILAYAKRGTLRVIWATVPAAQRDGVERYLKEKWNPLIGDAFPDLEPIAVNSPWD